jgi:hypothetical protein
MRTRSLGLGKTPARLMKAPCQGPCTLRCLNCCQFARCRAGARAGSRRPTPRHRQHRLTQGPGARLKGVATGLRSGAVAISAPRTRASSSAPIQGPSTEPRWQPRWRTWRGPAGRGRGHQEHLRAADGADAGALLDCRAHRAAGQHRQGDRRSRRRRAGRIKLASWSTKKKPASPFGLTG